MMPVCPFRPEMEDTTEKAGIRMPSPMTRPVPSMVTTSRARCAYRFVRNHLVVGREETGSSVRG